MANHSSYLFASLAVNSGPASDSKMNASSSRIRSSRRSKNKMTNLLNLPSSKKLGTISRRTKLHVLQNLKISKTWSHQRSHR
jgi:hypothetical protein